MNPPRFGSVPNVLGLHSLRLNETHAMLPIESTQILSGAQD